MIPRITEGGRSFKGAMSYYLFDKDGETRERVAWTHTENILTDDPDAAWRVMAYTAKQQDRLKESSGQKMTGRKLSKPVFAYSLAWHPEQNPAAEHMLETARSSIAALGLTEHEALIIAHRDEPQKHVHVVINRVHPVTGIAGNVSNSKLKLSDFAHEYESSHGKIYCEQRKENQRKRKNGEKTMYRDPVIAEAWKNSDGGRGFVAGLKAKGYQLAQGNKRLVVIDPHGQTHNPLRHLENVRAKELSDRLKDVDTSALPEATKLAAAVQAENRRRYEESRKHDEAAAKAKAELQNRQLEEKNKVSHEYVQKLQRNQSELQKHHRLDELKSEAELLRKKTQNPPWWKRLVGIAKADRAKLAEKELTLRNAEWRIAEKVSALEAARERALAALKERQAKEERQSTERLEAKKPENYVNQAQREQMRRHFDQRKQRERSGPELERD